MRKGVAVARPTLPSPASWGRLAVHKVFIVVFGNTDVLIE